MWTPILGHESERSQKIRVSGHENWQAYQRPMAAVERLKNGREQIFNV